MKLESVFLCALSLALSVGALAAEPKLLKDVNVSALTAETQKTSTDDGIHLAWWIPPEYWESSILQSGDVAEKQRNAMIKTLRGYSMLAVTQAEVGSFGNVSFYPRDLIVKGLKIERSDGTGWATMQPVEKVPDELQMLLKVMTPILEAALGKLGGNLQFFVLDDEVKGKRVISPYGSSTLRVTLTRKDGVVLAPLTFEMPLDSLYVPRVCPNGKPAHISWVVCPWDGSPLPK